MRWPRAKMIKMYNTTNNYAILAALLQHKEDNFSKLTVKNISQKICAEQSFDQLSLGVIDAIAISSPPEDNTAIFRDDQLALALQQIEGDEVGKV